MIFLSITANEFLSFDDNMIFLPWYHNFFPVISDAKEQAFTITMMNQVQYSLKSSQIFEYRATKVWRQLKDKGVVEKGGGRDGDYRYTNIKIVVPDDESGVPFLDATYGTTTTINAAVNNIHARYHMQNDKKTVVLLIKNHAGWTQGMTRVHFIRFKDEFEAEDFVSRYNLLSDKLSKKPEERKKCLTNHHSKLGNKSIDEVRVDEYVAAGEKEEEKKKDKEVGGGKQDIEETVDEEEGEEAKGKWNKEDEEDEDDTGGKDDDDDDDTAGGTEEDEQVDSDVSDDEKNDDEFSTTEDDDGSIDLLVDEANTQDWPHVFSLKISDDD